MKKSLGLALFLAATGLLLAASEKKAITVAAGETRTAAVNAFNARLDIRGKVDESVFLLGGSLSLDGEVTGDVICIASQVEIGERAVIGRDLIVIGGHLLKAEGSRITGEVYNVRTQKDLKRIASSLLPFLPESGGLTFFKIIRIFFWLILTLLALAILPRPVTQAAAMLGEAPLRHMLRGLLTQLAFVLLLVVFLVLSFVLIGIPLLIVLLAAYFLLLIFGRAAVFYFIGDSICRFLKVKGGAALFIVLGLAAYTLLKFIPFLGFLLVFFLDLFAIGIGMGYFLRRRKAAI
jgi:hypothetical protein